MACTDQPWPHLPPTHLCPTHLRVHLSLGHLHEHLHVYLRVHLSLGHLHEHLSPAHLPHCARAGRAPSSLCASQVFASGVLRFDAQIFGAQNFGADEGAFYYSEVHVCPRGGRFMWNLLCCSRSCRVSESHEMSHIFTYRCT